jgi:hypothetical protein
MPARDRRSPGQEIELLVASFSARPASTNLLHPGGQEQWHKLFEIVSAHA